MIPHINITKARKEHLRVYRQGLAMHDVLSKVLTHGQLTKGRGLRHCCLIRLAPSDSCARPFMYLNNYPGVLLIIKMVVALHILHRGKQRKAGT